MTNYERILKYAEELGKKKTFGTLTTIYILLVFIIYPVITFYAYLHPDYHIVSICIKLICVSSSVPLFIYGRIAYSKVEKFLTREIAVSDYSDEEKMELYKKYNIRS